MSSNGVTFPNLPKFRAKWVPIYMEPIMNSGEKITVGIAALSNDGHAEVLPTLQEDALRCAFGKDGLSLLEGAKICLDKFSEYLEKSKEFSGWEPPLTGVTLGEERQAAGKDFSEVLRMAARMSASLFADSVGAKKRVHMRGWRRQIFNTVTNRAPQLVRHFNQSIVLVQSGMETSFDYLGSRYVANFGTAYARKSDTLKDGRAKLWKLARCRDSYSNANKVIFEFLMLKPKSQILYYFKDLLYELEEEAKKEKLCTMLVNDATAAGARILETELASIQ